MGHQYPRILCSPEGLYGAGEEAADLAEACGLVLDPWQRLFLDEALKEREDGSWAAFEVGLMVSRQNGKGSCLEAIALAGLFLFGERLIIWSAHEFKTAKNAMERLVLLLSKSGQKFKATNSHGAEGVEILTGPNAGAKVLFQTRTKGSGLGLTADRIILDEAMMITPESLQALMPTLSSRPNPQIIYTGSAVDQRIHAHCEVFGGVRQRALDAIRTDTPGRLCYLEWSCPDDVEPPVDPSDPRNWAQSNPGLGYRQTEEKIADEYEAFKANLRAFGVQRLGIGDWPAFGDARSEISVERWNAMRNLKPALLGQPVITLYRAPEGGPWTIAAAQRTEDARIHLEVGYTGSDSVDIVVEHLVDTAAAWDTAAIVVGRGAASDLLPELEFAGIEPIVPNLQDEAQACGGLLNDSFVTVDGVPVLSHFDQPGLNNATKNAIKDDLPSGGFVWEIIEESAYAQLMGVTLSRWALLKYGGDTGQGSMVYAWPTPEEVEAFLSEQLEG